MKKSNGVQINSMTRLTARPVNKETRSIVQRKRSRSEVADESQTDANKEGSANANIQKPRILFPERAGVARKPKLEIDLSRLPDFNEYSTLPEVAEGCHEEMLNLEQEYAPDPEYLLRQPQLNPRMRAVLVDWMHEVGQEYGLKRDTLHTSINFVDRFLSRQENPVPRSELQLVGVTALWIASKMEEILPPPVIDFAAATDGGCTASQIIDMEGTMLLALDWKLLPCTPFAFTNYYLQTVCSNAQQRVQPEKPLMQRPWMAQTVVPPTQLNRVMEVLDAAMLDIDSLCFLPSVLAASAVMSLMLRANSDEQTTADLLQASGKTMDDLQDCMEWFEFALNLAPMPAAQYRSHVLESNLKTELHMIQRHNPSAIQLFKETVSSRNNAKHPAALRVLEKRRASVSSDELHEELDRAYKFSNKLHTFVSAFDAARSFSPMTQISNILEQTHVASDPANHVQLVGSSPQRQISFNEE